MELLDVEYLNKFTAKFTGQFYYFGVYINITDKGVYYNNVKVSDKVQGFMKQDLSF